MIDKKINSLAFSQLLVSCLYIWFGINNNKLSGGFIDFLNKVAKGQEQFNKDKLENSNTYKLGQNVANNTVDLGKKVVDNISSVPNHIQEVINSLNFKNQFIKVINFIIKNFINTHDINDSILFIENTISSLNKKLNYYNGGKNLSSPHKVLKNLYLINNGLDTADKFLKTTDNAINTANKIKTTFKNNGGSKYYKKKYGGEITIITVIALLYIVLKFYKDIKKLYQNATDIKKDIIGGKKIKKK
tara:strand:- start:1720 stop:2454 length:735 start_codon:yes stop_codon:yes gene_type:complete